MLTGLWAMIASKIGIVIFIYVGLFVVAMLDFWSGVRKAKKRGEFRSSAGYRRTVEKISRYYNLVFALTVTDFMQMGFLWQYNAEKCTHFPLLPFVTIIGSLFICLIEIKSIFEAADKKTKKEYAATATLVTEILSSKDKANTIMDIIHDITKDDENPDTGAERQVVQ